MLKTGRLTSGLHAKIWLSIFTVAYRGGETEVVIGRTVELVLRTTVQNNGQVTACRGFITLQLDANLGFAYLEVKTIFLLPI